MQPCRDKKRLKQINGRGSSSSSAVAISTPVSSVVTEQVGEQEKRNRESIIINIPGLQHPVRVVLAAQEEGKVSSTNMIFLKCGQCKEKHLSREMCRVELSHTGLPRNDTTYLCITIDETCFEKKQGEGNFCTIWFFRYERSIVSTSSPHV